jgi:phage terminase large subunit-like protein
MTHCRHSRDSGNPAILLLICVSDPGPRRRRSGIELRSSAAPASAGMTKVPALPLRRRRRPPIEVKSLSGVPPRPGTAPGPKEMLARLRALPAQKRREALVAAGEIHAKAVDDHWPAWVRTGQEPTRGDWTVWVMMAGRGFGKTRAGAEWVSEQARSVPGARIALVAATPEEARRVMIEGPSGLLACARSGEERRLICWEPGNRRLRFASGAEAFVYSGANGESLRGPEHHFAWCDELAKWKQAQSAWDNLMLGLRAGKRPQAVVTTTPRSVATLKAILAMGEGVVEETGGRTRDNPHVAPVFVETMERLHGGTRLGRQELDGVLLENAEGALFPRDLIERCRVTGDSHFSRHGARLNAGRRESDCPFRRIVVGVDPPITAGGDECGILVCGLGSDGVGYVLADRSAGGLSPEGWARRVAETAEAWGADRVVAEGNQGGEMVESVLRGAGWRLPVKRVHARTGKSARAEPVAALFERCEAKLAGRFPKLEDQLAGLVAGGDYEGPGRSPDRADALVWAMTELMLGPPRGEPRIRRL